MFGIGRSFVLMKYFLEQKQKYIVNMQAGYMLENIFNAIFGN